MVDVVKILNFGGGQLFGGDGFYCLIIDLLTGFDPCQKWLRVKLVLALHSHF